MVLQKINVIERKDGKYSIKPKKELEMGNHIVLEKINDTPVKEFEKDFGQGPKKSYLWVQKLEDIEVSFFLTQKQNEELLNTGKIGDKLQVTKVEGRFENPQTKIKIIYDTLEFKVME